jgi:phage terminase large subunit
VDYISQHGLFMDKYCAELDAKDYHGTDYVPHDARVKSVETGRTRLETLINLGRKPELVPDHKVMDGINAARVTFPRVHFDGTRCKEGLEALRQYRAEYDEKTRAFRDTPKKDCATHPADAFRYLCMAWRTEAKPTDEPAKPLFKPLNEITMDEWMKADEVVAGRRETL